jgi:hypothetical protein
MEAHGILPVFGIRVEGIEIVAKESACAEVKINVPLYKNKAYM